MKKCLTIIFLILLTISLAYGLEECARQNRNKDLPCFHVTSTSPDNVCNSYTAGTYSENGTRLYTQTFGTIGSSGRCNLTFNLTETGQYYTNSTIGTWNITVYQDNNMLSIILLQIFLIVFFIAVGLPHKAGFLKVIAWGMAVIEILLTVWMIYSNEMGNSITVFLYINAYAVLVIGGTIGFITMFMVMVKLSKPDDDGGIKQDSYTKWIYK